MLKPNEMARSEYKKQSVVLSFARTNEVPLRIRLRSREKDLERSLRVHRKRRAEVKSMFVFYNVRESLFDNSARREG